MSEIAVPRIASHDDALRFLDDRIGQGVKPGLERIRGLLAFMGDPQDGYPSIHIAGTNGKSTVCRMVQQILGAHGFATGGFTSPHLDHVEERFAVRGSPIAPDDLTQAIADIAWFVVGFESEAGTPVTYFEVTAALAFSLFAQEAVDVAVVEVGLGGRLDATNVLDADVAVITGIDIDHTEYLGTTIEAITAEKAAILGASGTLVTGPLPEPSIGVVTDRVEQTSSRWIRSGSDFGVVDATVGVGGWQCSIEGVYDEYPELFLPIHGRHQVDHLATAIAASELFTGRALDPDALALAVASLTAPGRIEVVGRRPIVLLDGAHNPQGFRGLAQALEDEFPPIEWQLVLGVRGDRPVEAMLEPLTGFVAAVHATAADDPASRDPEELARRASAVLGVPARPAPNPVEAVGRARDEAGPDGGVVVSGSLYVVGDVRDTFTPGPDRGSEVHMRYEAAPDPDDEDEELPTSR